MELRRGCESAEAPSAPQTGQHPLPTTLPHLPVPRRISGAWEILSAAGTRGRVRHAFSKDLSAENSSIGAAMSIPRSDNVPASFTWNPV